MFQDQYPEDDYSTPLAGDLTLDNSGADVEELPAATSPDWNIKGWSEERLKLLGRRLTEEVDDWYAAVDTRISNMAEWRRDYEIMPSDGPEPWDRSANVPSEGVRVSCDNHATRLNQQIVNANPPFSCAAKELEAIEAAPQIEEAMTGVLEEATWDVAADEVHNLLPRDGNCFFRTTYEIEERRKPVLKLDHDAEMSRALMDAGMDAAPAMYAGLKKDKDGAAVRAIAFENEVVYQGIRFRSIPFEDGVIIPASCRKIENARGIGERLMVSGEELRLGAKAGLYMKRAVDDLLRYDGDDPNSGPGATAIWERLDAQGLAQDAGADDVLDDPQKLYAQYECFHLCYRGDWNGDGYMEWARILVHHETSTILKFQYLPWDHGEPEYDLFTYLPRPGHLLGQGIAEMIASFQDAETAVLNQTINHADLIIHLGSSLVMSRSAGINADRFELKLGKPIVVNASVDEIKQFPVQPLHPEHLTLLQVLKDKRDLLTRSTNTAVGKEAPGQQTLGELQILTAAGNLQFEDAAARVARTWAKVFDKARWLVRQFGEGGEVRYRRTAQPALQLTADTEGTGGVPQPEQEPFGRISAEVLGAKVDIVPTGLAQLADLQSRIQQAQSAWAILSPLPEVQADPRLKIELIDYVLTCYRIPNRQKFIDGLRTFYAEQAAAIQQQQMAMGAAATAEQDGQAAEMDAQMAGTGAQIQAAMADEGMTMPPPGGGAPMGPAGPMTAAMPPGNGSAPMGAI